MREALIQTGSGESEAIVLRNLADVDEYIDFLQPKIDRYMELVLIGQEPDDKLGDSIKGTRAESVIKLGIAKSKTDGTGSVIAMGVAAMQMMDQIRDCVSQGDTVLINPVGGFKFFDQNCEIVDEWDFKEEKEKNYLINKGTKYINLENDPVLEEHSKRYLEGVDDNYSYVVNMKQLSKDEMKDIFDEFKKAGGEVVYVYTTGTDVDQMYEYFEAAVSAGIDEFQFEFNAGMTNGIKGFLEYLGGQDIALDIIENSDPRLDVRQSRNRARNR